MKNYILVLFSIFCAAPLFAQVTAWDMMHTMPNICNHPPHTSTWCEQTDRAAAAARNGPAVNGQPGPGMEVRVKAMIDKAVDPSKSSITIAYFSFSNKAAFNALCDAGKRGIKINGFFDNDYRADTANLPNQLKSCNKNPNQPNIDIRFLGQKKTDTSPIIWRLHHNKFLLVDYGNDDDIMLNFSSGNLSSSGLSLHFDHWGMLNVKRKSNIFKHHQCVVQGLLAASKASVSNPNAFDNPDLYRTTLDSCLSQAGAITKVETAMSAEAIAPLFSPNPDNEIYATLKNQIERTWKSGVTKCKPLGQPQVPCSRIFGAIQHFLHNGVANDLRTAVQKGVRVSLLMDNDVISGESEVPGVNQFYTSELKGQLSEIRFMETNAGIMQMMHNKFVVLQGIDGDPNRHRVFSGAGHFTTSALKNNYENFYITENAGLTSKYISLYDFMYGLSLTEAQVSQ